MPTLTTKQMDQLVEVIQAQDVEIEKLNTENESLKRQKNYLLEQWLEASSNLSLLKIKVERHKKGIMNVLPVFVTGGYVK